MAVSISGNRQLPETAGKPENARLLIDAKGMQIVIPDIAKRKSGSDLSDQI
jgi:hypothetical protein